MGKRFQFPRTPGMFKAIVIVVVLVIGGIIDGSWKGSVAWGIIMGVLWFLWELIHYVPGESPVRPSVPTDDFKLGTPAIRGRRNPDPTRPTTDDFAGMLTNYIERKRGL